jgi:hypothetical protein
MSSPDLIGAGAASLSPRRLRDFAKATGWQRVQITAAVPVALFEHDKHPDHQLLIPSDQASPDYENRVRDVIGTLAETSDLSPGEVLMALLNFDADVLRFSVASDLTESGQIPLQQGIDLLDGAKRALLASACSVVHPEKHHPRMSWTAAIQLLQRCRLGQTERGSFVATILCPLDEARDTQARLFEDAEDVPFARSATRLLIASVQHMVSAIDEDTISKVLTPDESEPVVSANLCEALLAMQPTGPRSILTVSATWSPAVTPPPAARQVRVKQDHFTQIAIIYNELRPRKEPTETEQFVATVSTLNGTPGPDNRVSGEVTLTLLRDDESLRARADLIPDEYEVADKAHMSHRFVSFKARLVTTGTRTHVLESITGFSILAD